MDALDIRLPENTVDEILGIHFLEHINPHKVDALFQTFFKILKPGGKLILEMPDVVKLCEDCATAEDKSLALTCLFGALNTTGGDIEDITSPHLWGWWPEKLQDVLPKYGFHAVRILPQTTPHPGHNFRVETSKPS